MARVIRRGPIGKDVEKARNNDIVEAARQEFLLNGFQNATIDRIAKRSRVSRNTIYAVFGNKEDLFHRVLIESVPSNARGYTLLLDTSAPFEVVIRNLVDIFAETSDDVDAVNSLRLAISERDNFPLLAALAQANAIGLIGPLAQYLRSQAPHGSLTDQEATYYAYLLMQMSVGGFGTVLRGPEPAVGSKLWRDTVARLFTSGFPRKANTD